MEIELLDRYNPYTVPLSSLLVFKEENLITIILLKCPYLSICILTLLTLENNKPNRLYACPPRPPIAHPHA